MHPWLILDGRQPFVSISVEHHWYYILCLKRAYWPLQISFWPPILRRTVFITWRTPSRQVGIRFFVLKIWKPRSRRRRGPYVSKPNALKFNHQVFLGNLLTRSTNVIKFHSLLCSLFAAVILILKISPIFENPRNVVSLFLPRIRRLVQNGSLTFHRKFGH